MASVDEHPRIEISDRDAWRAWLEANHAQGVGVWVVTYKKHCGDRHVPWPDVVREALCFGWIDCRTRRVDHDRTSVLVTPRKPGSMWSAVNRRHVVELEAAGAMRPAGQRLVDAARADGSWTWLDDIEALVVPDDGDRKFYRADAGRPRVAHGGGRGAAAGASPEAPAPRAAGRGAGDRGEGLRGSPLGAGPRGGG